MRQTWQPLFRIVARSITCDILIGWSCWGNWQDGIPSSPVLHRHGETISANTQHFHLATKFVRFVFWLSNEILPLPYITLYNYPMGQSETRPGCVKTTRACRYSVVRTAAYTSKPRFRSPLPRWPLLLGAGNSSVGRPSDWKAKRNTDAGSIPRYGKGFFSQSQLPVQTVLRCPYSPVCNRMHQHLCARYKSQTLAAVPLSGHTKILHTLIEVGSAALAAATP